MLVFLFCIGITFVTIKQTFIEPACARGNVDFENLYDAEHIKRPLCHVLTGKGLDKRVLPCSLI